LQWAQDIVWENERVGGLRGTSKIGKESGAWEKGFLHVRENLGPLWPFHDPTHEPVYKQEDEEPCHNKKQCQQHFLKQCEHDAEHNQPEDDQRACERCQQKEEQKPEQPLPTSLHARCLQWEEMRRRIARFLFYNRSAQFALCIVAGFPPPPVFPVSPIIWSSGEMRRW